MNKGLKHIRKAIGNLPEFEAPAGIWENINDGLNKELQPLNYNTELLPEFKAPEKIWKNLDNNLPKPVLLLKARNNKLLLTVSGIAAALFIGLLLTIKFKSSEEPIIIYSEEVSPVIEFSPGTLDMDNTDFSNLMANCERSPEICSSTEFKELSNQLSEVQQEIKKLEIIIKNDSDPQLLKFYYRLENESIDIEKDILKLFI